MDNQLQSDSETLDQEMIAGCGRRLPPDCREVLEKTDFGRFEIKEDGIALDFDLGIEWFPRFAGREPCNASKNDDDGEGQGAFWTCACGERETDAQASQEPQSVLAA